VTPRRERAGDRARAAAASLQGRLGADSFQRAVQQSEDDFAGQLQDLLCGERGLNPGTLAPAQRRGAGAAALFVPDASVLAARSHTVVHAQACMQHCTASVYSGGFKIYKRFTQCTPPSAMLDGRANPEPYVGVQSWQRRTALRG
jgi:hypothetical protein